jgi:inhibitor of KinA sporulation pathway (predicted exonuclease)
MTNDLIIFDLEFTAWEGAMARRWSGPGEHREIVQIGAVRLAGAGLQEVAAFDVLVRPRINPQLSDYFVALTGISNEAVATGGLEFAPAYQHFCDFVGDVPLACFGGDHIVIAENLKLYGLAGAAPRSLNLRPWFEAAGVDLSGIHSGMIAQALGLDAVGRLHNAFDDARALAAAMRHLVSHGVAQPDFSATDSGSGR